MLSVAAAAAAEVPRLMISVPSDYPKGVTTVLKLMNYDTKAASFVGGGGGNVSDSNKKVLNFLDWSDVQSCCVFRNLFCFANKDHPHYCFLFNPLPLTGSGRGEGEVLIIPSIPVHCKPPFEWYGMGMGFDAKTNTLNIKIVGISHDYPKEFAAYIYELGSNSSSWRQIPSVPSNILYPMGVSAFGNMFYWLAYQGDFIISFDFNREEFGRTPRPRLNGVGPFHLVNFQGSLVAVNVKTPSNHIEIWVLTDPNKEWTLNYRIERDVCFNGPSRRGRLKHCAELEHGLFFVEYHEKWGEWWSDAIFLDLRCSDSIKRVLFPEEFDNRIECRRLGDAARLFSFTGSMISLKNYGNLLEAKEGEWCIGKAITNLI